MRLMTIGLAAGALFSMAAFSIARPPPLQPAAADEPALPGERTAHILRMQRPPVVHDDNENAGLAKSVQPEVLTWDRIYALAAVRARTRKGAFAPALDPAALALEAVRLGVGDFARFRINFHSNGPFHDPGPAAFGLHGALLAVDTARRNVAFLDSLHTLINERAKGEQSGVSQMDVDTVFASMSRARQKLADEIRQFRDGLDELKFLLGLSPRAALILDRQNVRAFSTVFDGVESWERGVKRTTAELSGLIDALPAPGDVIVNGEPVLERIERDAGHWEEVLAGAAQVALASRSKRDQIPNQPNSGVQLELRVRRGIRGLFEKRLAFQAEKRCYELAIRLKDQSLERLAAPPAPAVVSRSPLVKGVIDHQTQIVFAEKRLAELWTSFRAERLALYHDLGVLPYNDWKSFLADLPAVPVVAPRAAPAVPAKPADAAVPQPLPLPNPPRP